MESVVSDLTVYKEYLKLLRIEIARSPNKQRTIDDSDKLKFQAAKNVGAFDICISINEYRTNNNLDLLK